MSTPSFHAAQLALDLVGVFVFALSGGLVAVKKGFDLFGVLVLATAAALGGGILRDVLIGDVPPVGISDWRLLAAAALGGLVTFVYHPGVERISRLVRALDAMGLAAFAVAGSLKAVSFGVTPVASVLVGVTTAVGGGVIRDLLAGQVPEVLRRELYAVPAAIGAIVVVVAGELGQLSDWVLWAAVALVFGLRIVAVRLDLNAPKPLRTTGDPQRK
ncbi:trimeric intracellular cation channel family protein [Intrasporangium calvum]|uniref:Trimeric intracellular cation channel family protein n=1 Tax=Intrasporangium calvum TaxID=53358 RepID=A0ABT5GIP0_9MICO|nr:trimeric intracellular cation channel family protein [Intrasporangium calvum]MDC5697826.1 trimeric intracellular cation channel family protein [Intrasporangium calvum]